MEESNAAKPRSANVPGVSKLSTRPKVPLARVGSAAELIGSMTAEQQVIKNVSESAPAANPAEERSQDWATFTFSCSPKVREDMLTIAEITRCVCLMKGRFLNLRADMQNGIWTQDWILVNFLIPVDMPRMEVGTRTNAQLTDMLARQFPQACKVLKDITRTTEVPK